MKSILLKLIRFYQQSTLNFPASPLLLGAYSGCRSWPTCSHYALEVIEREGAFRGSVRAFSRMVRCNPLWPPQKHG